MVEKNSQSIKKLVMKNSVELRLNIKLMSSYDIFVLYSYTCSYVGM
jgi:hypothetical protein